jgi:mannosyltransferase
MMAKARVLILVPLIIAAILRLDGIGRQSLWFDEAATVHIAKQPAEQMLERIRTDERTPPLHYVILHDWIKLFGDSELSVRLPSAIAGTAAVWMLYLLVRRLFDSSDAGFWPAYLAAVLLAISPYQVEYAQEARAYSLMLLLGIWSCERFVALTHHRTPLREASYVIVSALLLYTHLYGVFALAAQHVAYAFWLGRVRGTLPPRRWLALNAAVAALFAPWVPTAIAWTRSVATADFWAHARPATWADIIHTYRLYAGSGLMFLALAALATYAMLRLRGWRTTLVLPATLAVLPVVVPVALSVLTKPTFADRYGLLAAAGLFTLAAVGLVAIPNRWGRVTAVIVLCVLTTGARGTGYIKPDWRSAGRFIAATVQPGDAVVINRKNATYLYDYYVKRPDPPLPRRSGFDGEAIPLSLPLDPPDRKVWLVLHGDLVTIDQILARGPWRVTAKHPFYGVQVFELSVETSPATTPASPPPSPANLRRSATP